jgi:hypothetical protein
MQPTQCLGKPVWCLHQAGLGCSTLLHILVDHKSHKSGNDWLLDCCMAEGVGHGFRSCPQPETFHVGINFLSSSTSTIISSCSVPTGCDNNQ